MSDDAVFIERFPPEEGEGPRLAIKDLIDVNGSVTTAGCRALAERQRPATRDAACVAVARQAGARLVGKVNLHELAYGTTGINPWYGTPENPADPGRVPGGSSSGSAVAVATGEADIALGTDTGGSVRIPASCCAVVGLKTTHGRIPLDGVWPLAPSFDTVGVLARQVSGAVSGMALLEPGFCPAPEAPGSVGIARFEGSVTVDPVIADAVAAALGGAGFEVRPVPVPGWDEAYAAQQLLLSAEALQVDGPLLEKSGGVGISELTMRRFEEAKARLGELAHARRLASAWTPSFLRLVESVGILCLPTLGVRPPRLDETVRGFNSLTAPVNLAGLPAISLPVPAPGRAPVGLQLVAPAGREDVLVAAAQAIEASLA